MKGHWISYSVAELAFIEARQTMSRRALRAAFVKAFGREDVSILNLHSLCKRKGWRTGRTGCFEKGFVPFNKGKPHPPRGRAAETQFKKGQLPHNTKFAGHERVSKDGYVEISVHETNPHTGYGRRYVLKHRWLWEQANGRVPSGMVLKVLDGNRLNTDPSNWVLVPRGLVPRLSGRFGRGYDEAPAELKPTIMAVAKLEHAVRRRNRSARFAEAK